MVAKSFQSYKICGEPYQKNGKPYVLVESPTSHMQKEVRWYAEGEYKAPQPKVHQTPQERLGFKEGFITIFRGNTYSFLDWFRKSSAKYHKMWGWYFESGEELPQLPTGIEPVRLEWSDVAEDEEDLKSDAEIRAALDKLLYEPTASKFQGEVGDKIEIPVVIKKIVPLDGGYYGPSTIYVMTDEEENEYVWTTTSNQSVEEDENCVVRGTIKKHRTYRGSDQTVLTRCRFIKEA